MTENATFPGTVCDILKVTAQGRFAYMEEIMASINDVAKRAHVAKSTVSLVVNNSGYVSEETRKKVEKAIEELNYQPSQLGRNLSNNRTDLIGVIIPDIAHPFFGTFVKYVEEALYKRGYKTVICATLERENMEQEFLNMLKRRAMDGIIMGAHSLLQEQYIKLTEPVVAFDRNLGNRIPLVQSDHKAGGRLAAEKLLESGCRRVVQVSGARVVNTPAHEYHTAFEEAFAGEDTIVYNVTMPHNAFREKDFAEAAARVFQEYPDVDGIFGADLVITACLQEARRRKIPIPSKVKMIAYDGTSVTRQNERIIDAVVQQIRELSYACAETMDQLVRVGKAEEHRKVIPVLYQKGETVTEL